MTENQEVVKAEDITKGFLGRTVPAEELAFSEVYRIKALLGGPSGSGKTQSVVTLPRMPDKEILVIDYDGRAEVLAGEPGIRILRLYDPDPNSPRAWRAGEAVRKELWGLVKKLKQGFPFSAVVEDSLTSMGNYAMNDATTLDTEHLGLGGAPGRSHWLPQIHFLRTHINSMRMLPCHYILTCHMEPMADEDTGGLKLFPKVTRSLKPEVPTWFNETYLCRRGNIKGRGFCYFWITKGSGRYDFFKSTLNQKGKFWKDPVVLDLDQEPAGFERLLGYRFGQLTPEDSEELEIQEEGEKKGGDSENSE